MGKSAPKSLRPRPLQALHREVPDYLKKIIFSVLCSGHVIEVVHACMAATLHGRVAKRGRSMLRTCLFETSFLQLDFSLCLVVCHAAPGSFRHIMSEVAASLLSMLLL